MMERVFKYRVITLHVFIGILIGVILLHPLTMGVAWFELKGTSVMTKSLWGFLLYRFENMFTVGVLPMTIGYASIGGSIGLAFALYHLAIVKQHRTFRFLTNQLAEELPLLIERGENEQVEFKSSVRWDFQKGNVNRSLETVIAKTVAGFMNHNGGSLLVGVTDAGEIVGLEHDYQTFKHRNRDGFERCIADIISSRLGGQNCTLIHCIFYEIEGLDICRILVEASPEPVYLTDGHVSRYFVRTGNGTRELDTREAMVHLSMK
jgi:hypothetical protein